MNLFIENLGNLLADLFVIWSYPSFALLLTVIGCYMAVCLVRNMVR